MPHKCIGYTVVKFHKLSMLVLERSEVITSCLSSFTFREMSPISIKQAEESSKVVLDMVVH
jgi:hypothetical protein